jgi:N utilization substance protein B
MGESLAKQRTSKKEALKLGRHWQDKSDKVRQWFREVIRQDNEYLAYLDRKNPSAEDQKKFISHLFKKVIFGKTVINDYFEEEVLRWAEDKDIIKALVEKNY